MVYPLDSVSSQVIHKQAEPVKIIKTLDDIHFYAGLFNPILFLIPYIYASEEDIHTKYKKVISQHS